MDAFNQWYRGSLPASIEALKSARKNLAKLPGNLESIRRIARGLQSAAEAHGLSGLGETARRVEASGPEDVQPWLDRLLAELGSLNGGAPQGTSPVILIIESDPQMARLLETLLAGPDRDILLARTAGEAMALLQETPVTLVVLDLGLPDTDGRNFLVSLRERAVTAALPVMVLSGMGGSQPKTECFALGADAYFEKPLAPEVLKAAVAARLHKSLEHRREARQDAVTGLPNRAAFVERFQGLVALSTRSKDPASLALLDFDYLRGLNEALGHVTGDAALRHAARTFSTALRRSDLLARWGGDEFVLLFPGTHLDGARIALDKVLASLSKNPFHIRDGTPVPLSFSAGLVSIPPGASLEQAMGEADRYLFLAKTSGRGRVIAETDRAVLPAIRILLAEDDEAAASRVMESLHREGFEVLHCRDGSAALQASLSVPFSLCILDLKGAAIGGHALLAEMRRGSQGPRLPVLLISPLGTDQDVVRGIELGADDYLMEPFSQYDLMARIRNLLRKE